jgi:hypothetical protein
VPPSARVLCSRAAPLCSKHKRRRPGSFDWRRTPGPSVLSACGRRYGQALYACPARRCPVRRGGVVGGLPGPSYRLYNCRRCAVQVRICRRCDHGNVYCAAECARVCRRESLRRAGARYQRTRRGAGHHAVRQRRYRAREHKVTHHGSPRHTGRCSVSEHAISAVESIGGHGPERRCDFCGARLPAWTRMRLWAWSG